MNRFKRLLVANRSEIAIRIFRAATELGIRTIAIYAEEDKLSLHRFKADEAYQAGEARGPIEAYLSIDEVIRVAKDAGADAIHPGYGFLSENPDFADACTAAGIVFIGPRAQSMRALGNKVAARELATSVGVPVMYKRVSHRDLLDFLPKRLSTVLWRVCDIIVDHLLLSGRPMTKSPRVRMAALSLATTAPRSSYDRASICLGEDFGTGRPKQHGVGEEIIAAAGAHARLGA